MRRRKGRGEDSSVPCSHRGLSVGLTNVSLLPDVSELGHARPQAVVYAILGGGGETHATEACRGYFTFFVGIAEASEVLEALSCFLGCLRVEGNGTHARPRHAGSFFSLFLVEVAESSTEIVEASVELAEVS